uniref:Neur_chan_LBD domain-containing protein n=1 Tax=Caenorhabditis japonica TaxID=281687 RepID=A0A8R1HNX1_CAEJA
MSVGGGWKASCENVTAKLEEDVVSCVIVDNSAMLNILLLLFLIPTLVSSSYNEDLIIERRPHHVDWEDLFMEYNRYSAPNRVRQEVNMTIEVVDIRGDRLIFEMNQNWRDERLRFVGVARVPVPAHIQPWIPDTYIRNGWDVVVEQKSLDLNYDGTFLLRQKYQVTVNADENTKELPLIIASFNNYGTDRIHYNLINSKIDLPSHSHLSSKPHQRKFDELRFDDVIVTVHSSSQIVDSLISNSTSV